jgi:hypothetical protein
MNRLVSKIVGRMAGKFKRQRLFEDLHALSLQGMNFGRGGDFKTSGEIYALNYVKTRITGQ